MGSAVAKSFQVLEAVATAKGRTRLSTIAADLGLQKSTAHRVLSELIELGYVEQDPATGLYGPTLRTWEIGAAVVADLPITQVASSALHDLHRQTGETISLVVRAGDDALYLDKIISPRPLGFSTRVGSRVPLPFSLGGIAILAASDDGADVVRRLATRDDLSRRVEVDATLRALDTARRRGHARATRLGVTAVAAVVVDRDSRVVAAINVSAPADRTSTEQRTANVEAVVAATTRLSESLGRI